MSERGWECPLQADVDADVDIGARLAPGDFVIACRQVASAFRTPPLSTTRALLQLARVKRLDELGVTGPVYAATTADASIDADPELRKFEAVFARDALRVDEFVGDLFPRLRRATIYSLAQVQGVQHDAAREEEPGKIVHEWRDPTDPVAQQITARSGWGWPYYGAVDTTPLFIRAVVALIDTDPKISKTGIQQRDGRRRALADSLSSAVSWLCDRVDEDPDGLLTYRRINPRGIENQTWRDSWDSLSHADGSLPNHNRPVAALDVQVLAHDALLAAARHLRGLDINRAQEAAGLEERANRVRAAMLESFWVDDGDGKGFFAAALDFSEAGTRRPLRIRTSDMGHLLVSGLLRGRDMRECREAVVRQLFAPGLLCSAGIRSLHAEEVRHWPGGYHTGNSWLWQSMYIADGLEQHGFGMLASELRARCQRVHVRTGLLPEFARGADDRGILNDRIVDIWQSADQRENRLEQPPQEVQAWTVASLYAAKRRVRRPGRYPPPTPLERDILEQLQDRPDGTGRPTEPVTGAVNRRRSF